jgi:hypothetical protein
MTRKIVLVMVLAAACGKKDGDKGKSGPARTVDPAPANAAIPAAWKGKIEFEAMKIADDFDKEGTVTAVVPKGWVAGKGIKAMREPPEGAQGFGFGTHMWPGSGCGGECKARPSAELEAEANKSFFSNLLAHTPPPKVIKDEKTPGHRLLVAEDQGGGMDHISIMSAWWDDGAKRFSFCTVELAMEAKDLEPAFEQACNQRPAD